MWSVLFAVVLGLAGTTLGVGVPLKEMTNEDIDNLATEVRERIDAAQLPCLPQGRYTLAVALLGSDFNRLIGDVRAVLQSKAEEAVQQQLGTSYSEDSEVVRSAMANVKMETKNFLKAQRDSIRSALSNLRVGRGRLMEDGLRGLAEAVRARPELTDEDLMVMVDVLSAELNMDETTSCDDLLSARDVLEFVLKMTEVMSEDAIMNAAQKLQDKLDAASNIPAPLATSLVETLTEVLTNVRATLVSTLQSVESLTEQKGNALPIEEVIEWLVNLAKAGKPREHPKNRDDDAEEAKRLIRKLWPSAMGKDVNKRSSQRPNFVFFLIDDLGFNDIGYHSSEIKSPYMDQLAKDGMTLENNYVAPACGPSRSTLLTGRYPWRIGAQHGVLRTDTPECLSRETPLIQESLKTLGYKTYMVGKWHLGFCNIACTPPHRGFDEFYGFYNGFVDHYNHTIDGFYDWRDGDRVDWSANGHYSAFLTRDRAIKNIQTHAQQNSNDPMFLYFALPTVHSPLQAPAEYLNMYSNEPDHKRRVVKAMVTLTDDVIKDVVNELKRNGMYDNTIIMMSSDNGGEAHMSSNAPLRGAKGSVWEGGVRVPGFIHSPMLGQSRGKVSKDLFHAADWYPTMMSLAGGSSNPSVDGVDQTNFLLHGGDSARSAVPIQIDYNPMPSMGQAALRVGKWKLIVGYPGLFNGYDAIKSGPNALHMTHESPNIMMKRSDYNYDWAAIAAYSAQMRDQIFLFDLEADPSETNNLAASYPSVVSQLKGQLRIYAQGHVKVGPLQASAAADPRRYGGAWSPGWC